MCVRAAALACAAAALVSGCGDVDGGSSRGPASSSAVVEKGAAVAPPAAPSPPINAATAPGLDRDGYPACPASDAWGKDPLGRGILVTVWSDHADSVTVLVRTQTGVDRARTEWIGPDDHFHVFDFPDVDHATVTDVLILTNTRRCYSIMDPATASG
ncbi:MAG: hypothetical protein ACRDU5_05390 [Mycobacterium sp.]